MSWNRGPLFIFLPGTAPQELTASLSYIGYAKTIDNFWMDGRIFYIFFFKQLRISPGSQCTYCQCCHTPSVRLNHEKRHAGGQKNIKNLKKFKVLECSEMARNAKKNCVCRRVCRHTCRHYLILMSAGVSADVSADASADTIFLKCSDWAKIWYATSLDIA